MADIPVFIVIKPVLCETYALYETGTESGHVYCRGKSVSDPFTKIELEQTKDNSMYYNLRFCQSNRYWAKDAANKWVVAMSKQPQEKTSEPSCTLFLPTVDDKGVLHLTHVQSGLRVKTDSSTTGLYLDEDGDRDSNSYAFTYVDWDALVNIPKSVVFRGDNNMILKAYTAATGCWHLQFGSADSNDEWSAQEVSLEPDGHLRIKCAYYGRFWSRRSDNWILADSTADSDKNADTLFWPVKVDDRTIALLNAGNKKFIKRFTSNNLTSCLSAEASKISTEAKLVVEELVLETNVYNVRYRMEDSRVFDEKPYLAGIGTAINESDTESVLSVKVVYEVIDTSSFTHSYSLKLDVKTNIKANFLWIAEGKVETSLDFTGTLAWGKTKSEKKAAEASFTIKVPPKSRAKVSYVGTQGTCSVPFSYTKKDHRCTDGKFVTSHHNDGIFHGTNYYSFRFEHPVVEPL